MRVGEKKKWKKVFDIAAKLIFVLLFVLGCLMSVGCLFGCFDLPKSPILASAWLLIAADLGVMALAWRASDTYD